MKIATIMIYIIIIIKYYYYYYCYLSFCHSILLSTKIFKFLSGWLHDYYHPRGYYYYITREYVIFVIYLKYFICYLLLLYFKTNDMGNTNKILEMIKKNMEHENQDNNHQKIRLTRE